MDLVVLGRDSGGNELWPLRPHGGQREDGAIEEQLESGLRLRVSPLAFFQASTDAAEVLFRTVVELATDSGCAFPGLLLDLCCGGGVLGLEVARAAVRAGAGLTRVIGIERDAEAVRDALANAAANGLQPPVYSARAGAVEDLLGEYTLGDTNGRDGAGLPSSGSAGAESEDGCRSTHPPARPVVAVLDPPRTGLAPSVCKLIRAQRNVSKVVFVSCNPHGHTLRRDYVVKGGSLANNLRVLCGPRGRGEPFRVERIVPVDMFAHTPHVELVIVASRRV